MVITSMLPLRAFFELALTGAKTKAEIKTTTRISIPGGCSRATTLQNFLSPVLATSNFVASNRLLNPELPARARVAPRGEI